MNRERILELADLIEKNKFVLAGDGQKVVFNMTAFYSMAAVPCQTAACIAGWAVLHFEKPTSNAIFDGLYNIPNRARELLDLTREQAIMLFLPSDLQKVTRKIAAETLRHFAKTGEIKWPDDIGSIPYSGYSVSIADSASGE